MKNKLILITLSLTFPIKANFFEPNFSATYLQEYKSELEGKVIKTTGRIDYSYPSNIRFEQKAPEQLLYISNPTQSWLYTPPIFEDMEGDLTVDPTGKKYPFAKLFDVLKEGLINNKYYHVNLIDKLNRIYEFKYSEKMKNQLGINKTLLKFKNKPELRNIDLLELEYTDGKKVVLTFKDVETKKTFSKDHFYFTTPKKSLNSKKSSEK